MEKATFVAQEYDNAIGLIMEHWKEKPSVCEPAKQMALLGKNMAKLRSATDIEERKKFRMIWQRAIATYWDLVWAIVEAKVDAGPPESLTFSPAERLFIDFGHLNSKYTTPNAHIFEQLKEASAVDMYQYNRLTDYLQENYALIFGKPYSGPVGGVTLEQKLDRFKRELKGAEGRRRMAVNTLFSQVEIISISELDGILKRLEDGLQDAVETDMRTKRVREADGAARDKIRENTRNFEFAEREFWALMDSLEQKLTNPAAEEEPEPEDEPVDEIEEIGDEDDMDALMAELEDEDVEEGVKPLKILPSEPANEPEPEPEPESAPAKAEPAREPEALDQSLKIIQNVLALHDRTKFLTGLIVHVTNEADRWKTRSEQAKNKFKGQGVPALKLELREGLNQKKDFMMLAARKARVDTSPLCQNQTKPLSAKRAGEIMMELTPLDPDMLRASRIRMFGIPRVLLVPGMGWGCYDWTDNSLIIPIFPVHSDVKDVCFALGDFRWDNDEDRTLKDTYALLKENKGKGIRALQEAFNNDYFLWISKERKGYKILPRNVSKWFKAFFKQKATNEPGKKPAMPK